MKKYTKKQFLNDNLEYYNTYLKKLINKKEFEYIYTHFCLAGLNQNVKKTQIQLCGDGSIELKIFYKNDEYQFLRLLITKQNEYILFKNNNYINENIIFSSTLDGRIIFK